MLLLPLLDRIFTVLRQPITGTDDASTHRRLKDSYLQFFTALMNANLDGIFITERNKPSFENVLTALLSLASDNRDPPSQRLAFSFFAKSIIAWGTSREAVTQPSVFAESALSEQSKAIGRGEGVATNQHAIPKEQRAEQALEGYETFIYGRLLPLCFEVPGGERFMPKPGQMVGPQKAFYVYCRLLIRRNRCCMRLQCFYAIHSLREVKRRLISCWGIYCLGSSFRRR
jgi:exportin-T